MITSHTTACITLFSLCTFSSFSQSNSKIELLNANSLEYDEKMGNKVRRLIGQVGFRQDDVFLYCDSAWMYVDLNRLDAFSNVRMQQGGGISLYGDMLQYDGDTKKAELTGNARVSDNKMQLTTDKIYYDTRTGMASYTTGGKITDKDNTLTSGEGYYNTKSRDFLFRKNVVLENPGYSMNSDSLRYSTADKIAWFTGPTTIRSKEDEIYCEEGWYNTATNLSQYVKNASLVSKTQTMRGDTLYYDRKNAEGKAYGHVQLYDTTEHLSIGGDYAEFSQRSNRAFVTGHAVLIQAYETDSLFLHADTLRAMHDSVRVETPEVKGRKNKAQKKEPLYEKFRILTAFHHVRIFKSDLQGVCDSLVYSFKDSTISLYKEPVLWSDKNQLTAEFIKIQQKNNRIETMYLYESAFIVSMEDSLRYNQVKGKNMVGYFRNNALYKISVEGNGQTVYWGREEKKGTADSSVTRKLIGVNRAECSNLMVYIKQNKIEKITLLKAPDATFFPAQDVNPKELLLKGFSWKAQRRPLSKDDLFNIR